jgi:hypothetical protein
MSLRLVSSAVLLLVGAVACAPGQVAPVQGCTRPADSGVPLSADQFAQLAGHYDLILVNSEGEYGDSVVRGTLTLWANDSARRYMSRSIGRYPGERPLAGRFESLSATVPSYPNRWDPGGPERPAVELIGPTLYFGGIDATDGAGQRLQVTEIRATGFAGRWEYSGGIEVTVDTASGRVVRDPSGHFCAARRAQD